MTEGDAWGLTHAKAFSALLLCRGHGQRQSRLVLLLAGRIITTAARAAVAVFVAVVAVAPIAKATLLVEDAALWGSSPAGGAVVQ